MWDDRDRKVNMVLGVTNPANTFEVPVEPANHSNENRQLVEARAWSAPSRSQQNCTWLHSEA